MRNVWSGIGLVLGSASASLANEPAVGHADYSGITGMYYTLIGLILAWGVYDTFFRKAN